MRQLYSLNVFDTIKDKAKGKLSFAYATISCLRWQLLGLVLPRAAMVAFIYSQTFLIEATISYLEKPVDQRSITHANGLIGAAVLIYVGIAVSDHDIVSTELISRIVGHSELQSQDLQDGYYVSWRYSVHNLHCSTFIGPGVQSTECGHIDVHRY